MFFYLIFCYDPFFCSRFILVSCSFLFLRALLMALVLPNEDSFGRGLFWSPFEALLEPSWGTVGAYQFDMLKKQESSATAEKLGPAAGGQALWETMSKQVYLEGF